MMKLSLNRMVSCRVAGLALLLWAGAGDAVRANENPAPAAVPKIEFAEMVHDFGRIPASEVVKHEYVFTNTGSATLNITHVQASCGCTAAGNWSREVAPGATGTIPIQFNGANFNGPIFKTVTVHCNDPARATVSLQLKATVWKPVEMQPAFAVINVAANATGSASTVVRVLIHQEEPITIHSPTSSLPTFTAEVYTNTPGRDYNLVIRTVPPLLPGNTQGQISFKTTATNMPTMSIPVLAIVQPVVVASPAQITLPAQPSAQPQTHVVVIRNNSAAPLTVSDPASNVAAVTVALKEVEPGRQFNLEVTFPAGYDMPEGQRLEITARTSHPSHPVIKVPVNQFPRPRVSAAR